MKKGRSAFLTTAIIATLFATLAAGAEDVIEVGTPAPEFEYEMKSGGKDSLEAHEGEVVIIFNSGRPAFKDTLKAIKEVKETLGIPHEETAIPGEVACLCVANLKGIPKAVVLAIKDPTLPPILGDFKNDFVKKYGGNHKESNIYIIDRTGKIAFTGVLAPKGEVTAEQVIEKAEELLNQNKEDLTEE